MSASRMGTSFFLFIALSHTSLLSLGVAHGARPAQRSAAAATSLIVGSSAALAQEETAVSTSTVVRIEEEDDWEIQGPVFLRSATPEETGEVVVKNIFGWEHNREGSEEDRDEYEYELEIEWGVAENHELIFELPFQVGEGDVDGNGDLTLGWHWRLMKEEGSRPAFALRNYLRLPTGSDSNGVDYELRGLITKTITPGCTRLHLNPFAKSINGDNEPEARHFQWGAAVGIDHRLNEHLTLIADYIYSNGEEEHTRDNHEAELGLDWEIDERQSLGIAVMTSLDGDTHDPAAGAKISYMLHFGG